MTESKARISKILSPQHAVDNTEVEASLKDFGLDCLEGLYY